MMAHIMAVLIFYAFLATSERLRGCILASAIILGGRVMWRHIRQKGGGVILMYRYTNQIQIKSIKSGIGLCNKVIESNRTTKYYQSNQIEASGLFDLIVDKYSTVRTVNPVFPGTCSMNRSGSRRKTGASSEKQRATNSARVRWRPFRIPSTIQSRRKQRTARKIAPLLSRPQT
jgi:hypothetical protein